MFLVAQMSEVLIWTIFQYDGLISQLPHQGMRDLLPGKKKAQCLCGCVYEGICLISNHTHNSSFL